MIAFGRHETEVSCFDAQWLSCFDHEKEVLFFGSDSILKICNISKYEQNKWKGFSTEMRAIQVIRAMYNGMGIPRNISSKAKVSLLHMLQSIFDPKTFDRPDGYIYIYHLMYNRCFVIKWRWHLRSWISIGIF